ncbi:MAG: TIGR02147 family protein [Myxococcota bacterium]
MAESPTEEELRKRGPYIAMLKEHMEWRGMTGRALSEAVGRSRPWMSQVLNGRRALVPKLAVAVAEALEMNVRHQEQFVSLVEIAWERSVYGSDVAEAFLRTQPAVHATEAEIEAQRPLAKWYVAAVLELAACDGYRPDPRWIAATLEPTIEPEQAQEALDALKEIGLLQSDGCLGKGPPPEITNIDMGEALASDMKSFHRSVLALGSAALQRFRPSERYFRGTCMALSEAAASQFRERLHALFLEFMEHAANDPAATNRVYMSSLAFFPASLFTDTEYEPDELEES